MSASFNELSEAKTIVLWDIEDCRIPDGLDPPMVQNNIKSALSNVNYHGEVLIRAYGDTNLFPDIFHPLGITPIRIGDKHARVNKIINDMFICAFENSSEQLNMMVISGDVSNCFIEAICYLEERNYNILLAQPQNALEPPPLLRRSVSSIWRWTSLSAGRGYPFATKANAQVPRDNNRVVDQNGSSSSERYNRSRKRRHSINLSSSEYSTSSSSSRRYRSSPSPSPRRYRRSSPSPSPRRYRRSSPRRYSSSPSTNSSSLRSYRSSPSPRRYRRSSSPSPRYHSRRHYN